MSQAALQSAHSINHCLCFLDLATSLFASAVTLHSLKLIQAWCGYLSRQRTYTFWLTDTITLVFPRILWLRRPQYHQKPSQYVVGAASAPPVQAPVTLNPTSVQSPTTNPSSHPGFLYLTNAPSGQNKGSMAPVGMPSSPTLYGYTAMQPKSKKAKVPKSDKSGGKAKSPKPKF